MTLSEYLQNPYGKGASFAGLGMQKAELNKQFMELADQFSCTIYIIKGDKYVYHIKVPSRNKDKRGEYDVLIEVDKNEVKDAKSIMGASLHVFSNCPSFIFSYAAVFHFNKMDCLWANIKYSNGVVDKLPSKTNNPKLIGLERSLYLALKYISSSGVGLKAVAEKVGIRHKRYYDILRNVRSQEDILHIEKIDEDILKRKAKIDDKGKEKVKKTAHSTTKTDYTKKVNKTSKTIRGNKTATVKKVSKY